MNQSAPAVASFAGVWQSSQMEGEARIEVRADCVRGLCGSAAQAVAYADVRAIEMSSWAVTIDTDRESIVVSRMGQQLVWLYRKLRDAFNDRVAIALLVGDPCLMSARGTFRYLEEGRELARGAASPDERTDVRLHSDCLCVLPPTCQARRIPLAFLGDVRAQDYALHLSLTTGESYEVGQLGFDLEALVRRVEAARQALTAAAARRAAALDPSLASDQAARVGSLMPGAAGASLASLAACAPSLPAAIGAFLAQREQELYGDMDGGEGADGVASAVPACLPSECFAALLRLCPPELLLVGMTSPASSDAGADDAAADIMSCDFWFAALSLDRTTALVEYALADGQQGATYVYREPAGGAAVAAGGAASASTLPLALLVSRAQEAMGTNRACMRLSDDELQRPENHEAAMAIMRTPTLRALRARFVGRIIHKTPQDWERRVRETLQA